MAQVINSYTHFLQRDGLYSHEKPYSLRFTAADPEFPRANIKLERHAIEIEDVRDQNLSFEQTGCTILNLESQMGYDDYADEDKIRSIYLREVADCLKDFLGAQHVQIFEHTVRKRHEIFPISTGEPYQYNQPTSIAHVDTTLPWALAMAQQLNPDRADEIVQHRIQCVNFWKPIKGPVKDWPLALCMPKTIKPIEDFEPCDLVYPDYVVENRQVYHSKRYKWVYLDGQVPNEAWVFLQADTFSEDKCVAHTAFPLPDARPDEVPSRESIEVRALVYYGGFDDRVNKTNY